MVERSPGGNTQRTSTQLHVPQTRVCRMLHKGVYPYYVQHVQGLKPRDHAQQWLEFSNWLNANQQLHQYVLFCDETQFTLTVLTTLVLHMCGQK
jgi:hypothetical protein